MDPEAARRRMVEHVDPELPATRDALLTVPRHEFVPEAWLEIAYADRPIPLGRGQTISAPSIVAEMCDHLALEWGDRTLEIGTGSGYHTAITAEIVGAQHTYSIEVDPEMAATARSNLDRLGYDSVRIHIGNGRLGWSEHAPYSKVYLTCAVRELPNAIINQTKPGGLILAPIGIAEQRLVLHKPPTDESDAIDRLDCGPVQFVPMTGPEDEPETDDPSEPE